MQWVRGVFAYWTAKRCFTMTAGAPNHSIVGTWFSWMGTLPSYLFTFHEEEEPVGAPVPKWSLQVGVTWSVPPSFYATDKRYRGNAVGTSSCLRVELQSAFYYPKFHRLLTWSSMLLPPQSLSNQLWYYRFGSCRRRDASYQAPL